MSGESRITGEALLDALESGRVRAAEPRGDGWIVNAWVKEELLAIFRTSPVVALDPVARGESDDEHDADQALFRDKAAFPLRRFGERDGVRIVPGGSAVRRGAHLAEGVVCMPPMYVNLGAFVGRNSMIDSHALIGSCAQVGADVHISAAAQIGGVLEPAGARPVIVEDGAFVGGGVGLYEGVRVGRGAVLAAGVVLTASTRVYDLVDSRELCGTSSEPLEIPERSVIVPGSRPVSTEWGRKLGLQQACALLIKYRDEGTDAATALEDALR